MSLSRLIEFLLSKITTGHYNSLEDFPVSDWVNMVAEGQVMYERKATKKRKQLKKEFHERKK